LLVVLNSEVDGDAEVGGELDGAVSSDVFRASLMVASAVAALLEPAMEKRNAEVDDGGNQR
jgi:hypothetical protein